MFDEFDEPITTIASQRSAIASSDDWRLVVAKHRSLRPGIHTSGNRSRTRTATPSQSRCDKVVWASKRHRFVEHGQFVHLVHRFDTADRARSDRHRADRFLVALVADVHDPVALAGPHLDLVMDLRDQGTHRVDDEAATFLCGGHDLGCRAVGRQHDRAPGRHVGDIVDEHHTLVFEPLDHELVVDDLVVAVDRWLERTHHPGQRLDRHLHPGAEPARFGEQDAVDAHDDRGGAGFGGRPGELPATSLRMSSKRVPGNRSIAWTGHVSTDDRLRRPGFPGGCLRAPARRRDRARRRPDTARRDRVADVHRRGRSLARRVAQRARSRCHDRQAGRRATRRRDPIGRVRSGTNLRQPLRVLLHLSVAQGHAAQPVSQGRRLPAQLPVRQLHDADPVHRGRSRTCRDRTAVTAARVDPRHRPRDPQPDAQESAGRA